MKKVQIVFHRSFAFSAIFLSAVGRVVVLLIPVEGLLLSFSRENRQVSPWQPRMLTSSRLFDLFYWMTSRQLSQNSVWLLVNRRTSKWVDEARRIEGWRSFDLAIGGQLNDISKRVWVPLLGRSGVEPVGSDLQRRVWETICRHAGCFESIMTEAWYFGRCADVNWWPWLCEAGCHSWHRNMKKSWNFRNHNLSCFLTARSHRVIRISLILVNHIVWGFFVTFLLTQKF